MERVSSGQIGARWFEDCRRVVRPFAKSVGVSRPVMSLTAADFQRYRRLLVTEGLRGGRGLGVQALTRTITVVRGLFKWAVETGLLKQALLWGNHRASPPTPGRLACSPHGGRASRSSLHTLSPSGLRLALSPRRTHPRNPIKNRYDSFRTAQPGLRPEPSPCPCVAGATVPRSPGSEGEKVAAFAVG
jgi:hypothetical protein